MLVFDAGGSCICISIKGLRTLELFVHRYYSMVQSPQHIEHLACSSENFRGGAVNPMLKGYL